MQAYAATYSGHAKIDRRVFLADRSQDTSRELEALKMAAAELKKVSGEGTGFEGAECGWVSGVGGVKGRRGLLVQQALH